MNSIIIYILYLIILKTLKLQSAKVLPQRAVQLEKKTGKVLWVISHVS